jgi:pyridoxamine 5'-phosphate oxidase
MDKSILASLRKSYVLNELLEQNVSESPISQFKLWFKDALESEIIEPNAMVLSTVKEDKPSARVVLLKGFDESGFSFFTNYNSHKAKDIKQNPFAALTFFWDVMERQVRIEGKIEKLSAAESDTYFWSRPRESQIGAWVSEQSTVIESREVLDQSLDFYIKKFNDLEIIPRPVHWGGFLLRPSAIEFWQGRQSRLHDRILYSFSSGIWKISRLSP